MDNGLILDIMTDTAIKAMELIKSTNDDFCIEEKTSGKDLVTKYDKQVQQLCIENISRSLPDAAFFAEESPESSYLNNDLVFIIDPIDGTTNFIHGLRYSAVSIACCRNGVITAGVVCDPYSENIYSAMKGQGAFLNGSPIHVSSDRLERSIVFFGTSPYDTNMADDTFALIKELFFKCRDIRRFGAAALDLCQVAAGRAGLFFELNLSLWDYAAAGLIVKEAGGVITDIFGREIEVTPQKTSVVAGTKQTILESGVIREKS